MKPKHIYENPLADQYWNDIKSLLEKAGKWKPEFAVTFHLLIDALVEIEKLRTFIEVNDEPLMRMGKNMIPYPNPIYHMLIGAKQNAWKCAREYGLTPAADAKLKGESLGALEPLFEILKTPR